MSWNEKKWKYEVVHLTKELNGLHIALPYYLISPNCLFIEQREAFQWGYDKSNEKSLLSIIRWKIRAWRNKRYFKKGENKACGG